MNSCLLIRSPRRCPIAVACAVQRSSRSPNGRAFGGLRSDFLVNGRKHDGGIRVTRGPRGEPPTCLFNVSGPTRGRSETPQPIGHSRDLTVMYVDLAMFCRR